MTEMNQINAAENNVEVPVAVGKVRDSHGLKGELFVVTNLKDAPPWVEEIKQFTLKFKAPNTDGKHEESLRSFSVKKARPHKKGFIVKTDEIEDRNASDLFKGAEFCISNKYLETQKGDKIYLTEIKNFDVYDGDTHLGIITNFSSNNAQDLLIVKKDERTLEIPFVKAFTEKINYEAKSVHLNLPEGLY